MSGGSGASDDVVNEKKRRKHIFWSINCKQRALNENRIDFQSKGTPITDGTNFIRIRIGRQTRKKKKKSIVEYKFCYVHWNKISK